MMMMMTAGAPIKGVCLINIVGLRWVYYGSSSSEAQGGKVLCLELSCERKLNLQLIKDRYYAAKKGHI